VGTAYRQRSQLLIFYFIFVAVGYVLLKERREERQRQAMDARNEIRSRNRRQPPQPEQSPEQSPPLPPREQPKAVTGVGEEQETGVGERG
jgi:hypothetical protein